MTADTITREYSKQIGASNITVSVTESLDTIFITIGGDVLDPKDAEKFCHFFHPLVHKYRKDTRTLRISGTNSDYTGVVQTSPAGLMSYFVEDKLQPFAGVN